MLKDIGYTALHVDDTNINTVIKVVGSYKLSLRSSSKRLCVTGVECLAHELSPFITTTSVWPWTVV